MCIRFSNFSACSILLYKDFHSFPLKNSFVSESCFFKEKISCCVRLIFWDCFCSFSISIHISFHSHKSIFDTDFCGSLNLKIISCKKSFAPRIICRSIYGSQPCAFIDCTVLAVISSCFTLRIFSSGTPSTNTTSTVLFHSCLAALSAYISASFRLFFPIFFVARYIPPY